VSHPAPLAASDFEDRFLIVGQTPIRFMLAGYARDAVPFSVRLGAAETQFMTTLLGVDAAKGRVYFDLSGSPEMNRLVLAADHLVFAGRPEGIHVQFQTPAPVEARFDGGRAFSVPLPRDVLRLQRRESFRIDLPLVRPVQLSANLPGGGTLSLPVHNLSVAGLGLTAAVLPETLLEDVVLARGRFLLPEEVQPTLVDLRIRHLTEQTARNGQRQWRIGCAFVDLPAAEEHRLQRYIVRIEHERHELAG
jgi:c-di-GMP-binding flagellar brake protein YcgR